MDFRADLLRVSKFYDPGQGRSAKVHELFSRIAPRYDFINDLQSLGLHRRWKRRVIDLASPRAGDRALDICCGTADLLMALQKLSVRAVGLDFTQPMLTRAADRGAALLVQGDAQLLPFPDNTFDIVTVGYGLRNLASWEKGLEEMYRVARPGGRLVVLDFGKPENGAWRAMYFGYLRLVVPVFGKVFCGDADAYGYILESLQAFTGQAGIAAKMHKLGCKDVRLVNVLGGAMGIVAGVK